MKTTLLTSRLVTGCLVGITSFATLPAFAQITAPSQGGTLTMQLRADGAGMSAPGGFGTDVSAWTEEGGGTSFSSTDAGRPVLAEETINGLTRNVVQYDGVGQSDILSTAAAVPLSDFVSANSGAIFLVARSSGAGGGQAGQTAFGWGGGTDRLFAQTEFGSDVIHFQYGNPSAGGDFTGGFNFGDNQWHLLALWRNGSTARIRVDGTTTFTGTFSDDLSGAAPAVVDVGGAFSNDRWNGAIAEVLTYNSGAIDINAVEIYLGSKYGFAAVPEPSQYAMIFGVACIAAAAFKRYRRQNAAA